MAGADLYSGSLELIILKSLSWGPLHGYAIGRWIRTTTHQQIDIKEGALYPALHRLERKGFLEEEWGITDTNREAKFYRLTPPGKKHLRDEILRWQGYARMMQATLSAGPA
ncbi:MAG TPA: PadR family transcriptional regulator [Gemmatimonadaceae bacterium]|nr:PadR family transcriptional regulator [Gemmatimonadaceae bacterium]